MFGVLIDDREVVCFEVLRGDPSATPRDVERFTVEEFRKDATGTARERFDYAVTLNKEALAASQ